MSDVLERDRLAFRSRHSRVGCFNRLAASSGALTEMPLQHIGHHESDDKERDQYRGQGKNAENCPDVCGLAE